MNRQLYLEKLTIEKLQNYKIKGIIMNVVFCLFHARSELGNGH